MRYVTTNIRLPEELWKTLKREAMERGLRLSEIIRRRLRSSFSIKKKPTEKPRSLLGILKDVDIPDSAIEEAKRALFPPLEKYR